MGESLSQQDMFNAARHGMDQYINVQYDCWEFLIVIMYTVLGKGGSFYIFFYFGNIYHIHKTQAIPENH